MENISFEIVSTVWTDNRYARIRRIDFRDPMSIVHMAPESLTVALVKQTSVRSGSHMPALTAKAILSLSDEIQDGVLVDNDEDFEGRRR